MPQQSRKLREKGHLYNLVYVEGRGASTILQTKREGAPLPSYIRRRQGCLSNLVYVEGRGSSTILYT